MTERKVPTIYDVAKKANVSPGTVSRYINGVGTSRGNTRERIEQAIQSLHYTPNRNARALKSRRNNLICLAYPETDNPFYFQMINAVEAELKKCGYMLMIYYTHGNPEEELRILRLTQEEVMDGLILVNFNYDKEHFDAFHQIKCPLVITSLCTSPYGGHKDDAFDYVGIDVSTAMYNSAMHMLNKGHERIAYIGGNRDLCVFSERWDGFKRALDERHIPQRDEYCFFGAYDETAGYYAGCQIANMDIKPTAIVTASDIIAIGAMRALQENEIRIPDDIAMIGLDNIHFDRSLHPQLSSHRMMQSEIGKVAVDLLMARINGDESLPKKIVYKTELIERASSGYNIQQ